ncbi:uncharacterized protein [Lepeophtheirus salmonis]|uniref:uncharacterized protein n=1 Tax=Lepeophtheirus salmonis TaxID=72036 RepID=UPI001AE3BC1B|nr:uncharacterized protein LOC121120036 [Lepeophtheirus salmonis]
MSTKMYYICLSFLISAITIYGEECKLPSLPKGYIARIQMNSEIGFFKSKSHSFTEIVDINPNRALIHSFTEIQYDEGPNKIFEEWGIWYPSMDGFKNFLHVLKDENNHYKCTVDDLSDNDLFLFLLGYSEKEKNPGVINTLHFGPNHGYTCGEETVINGVPVKEYTTKWVQNSDPVFEMDITYYWSVEGKWFGTTGPDQSMPINAKMTGKLGGSEEDTKDFKFDLVFSGFNALSESYNHNWLSHFPALPCKDRVPNIKINFYPEYFGFNFETHSTISNGEESFPITVRGREFHHITESYLRREFYYSPINKPGRVINLNIVKDFRKGLSYIMNIDEGTCLIKTITDHDSDAIVTPDGSIIMADSSHFWNSDQLYNSNGHVKIRGINATVLVRVIPRNNSESITKAIYFSADDWNEADDFVYAKGVPLRIETHVTSKYGDPKFATVQNIEGFTSTFRNLDIFDIGPCFLDEQKRRKMIRFPLKEGMLLGEFPELVKLSIRDSGSTCAGIEPIRLQNIEFIASEDSNLIYVFFDVLEVGKPNDGGLNPRFATLGLTLEGALKNLEEKINDSKFVIYVPSLGKSLKTIAEPNFFIDVQSEDAEAFRHLEPTTYGPGSMAGIAIGMLSIGILLGFASYYSLKRLDMVPALSLNRPFVHFNR